MTDEIYITPELAKDLTKLTHGMLDKKGREVLNPKPHVLAGGLKRPPTLQEQIQRLVRKNLSDQVAAQGHETFEEADDFDVQDDFEIEPTSKYEMMEEEFLQPEPEPTKVEAAQQPKGGTENEPSNNIPNPSADLQSGKAQDPGESPGQRKQD